MRISVIFSRKLFPIPPQLLIMASGERNQKGELFDPIATSRLIEENYRSYILTTFKTDIEEYNRQLREEFEQEGRLVRGPLLQVRDSFTRTKTIANLVDEGVLSYGFRNLNSEDLDIDKFRLYAHQERAIRRAVDGRSVVVSTGTGSGKTQSFILPMLHSLLEEAENGTLGPGVRAIIIYPMNALANDQMKRMRGLLENYPDITFGAFTGETEEHEDRGLSNYTSMHGKPPLPNEMVSRQRMRREPPHILITNYVMLEHLLIRPDNNRAILGPESSKNWKFLVLDEAHVYGGARGSEVSMLLRRLRAFSKPRKLIHILTSATLGSENENEEAALFANNLCALENVFQPDDIIRGTLNTPESSTSRDNPGLDFYREAAKCLRGEPFTDERAREIFGDSIDSTRLYDKILGDSFYNSFRLALEDGVLDLSELAERLGVPVDFITDFVTVANHAKRDGDRLFESRYHLFVNGLEGIFVTLKPSYKLETRRVERIVDNEEEYRAFEISVCYNCNAIHIIGRVQSDILVQPPPGSKLYDDGDRGNSIFYLMDESELKNVSHDFNKNGDYWKLCSKCGHLRTISDSRNTCVCGSRYFNYLREVKAKVVEGEKLHVCRGCGQENTRRSILRQFYLGQEAATSTLCSTLFSKLHGSENQQFIVFSDSRQSAALFSTYFDKFYRGNLSRRVIVETLQRHDETLRAEGMSFYSFQKELDICLDEIYARETFSEYISAGGESGFFSNERRKKETSKIRDLFAIDDSYYVLAKEAACYNSIGSLEFKGFLRFEIERTDRNLPGLSLEETNEFLNMLVKLARDRLAIDVPGLGVKYRKRLFGRASQIGLVKQSRDIKGASDTSFGTEPVRKYIAAVLGDESRVDEFIDEFMDIYFDYDSRYGIYTFPAKNLIVRKTDFYYRCDKCNKHFPFSVRGICPRCEGGVLEKVDFDFETSNDYYVRQYRNLPLGSLRIKEHTAQLGTHTASKYQKLFLQKEIDALSCSTTFELGVDIGDLNTVVMRNVPPSPVNYIQRSGRAGRSDDSCSFSLTYCKNSPHDSYYFKNPEEMVSGLIPTPIVKVDNPRIAIRHIFASAIAFFWQQDNEALEDVEASMKSETAERFLSDEKYEKLEYFVRNPPQELIDYLQEIVPESLQDYRVPGEDESRCLNISLADSGWVDAFVGERGHLRELRDRFRGDTNTLDERFKELKLKLDEGYDNSTLSEMQSVASTRDSMMGESVLPFLSRSNIIPKYGFPADLVNLEPNIMWEGRGLELERELSMAISEYAPGAQIIADGNIITSRYVKKPYGFNWEKYAYKECRSCASINTKLVAAESSSTTEITHCYACDEELGPTNEYFIIPRYGFVFLSDEVKPAEGSRPPREYRTDVAYRGDGGKLAMHSLALGRQIVEYSYNSDDELVVINKSKSSICGSCGYTKKNWTEEWDHWTHLGRTCSGKMTPLSLGHILKTDVSLLRFKGHSLESRGRAYSVMYSLILGICKTFKIESREISGCLHYSGRSYQFVFFDNTPGGAGYVKALCEASAMREVIKNSVEILEACECGGPEGDGSCYCCLRDYRNQRHHEMLNRGQALEYLRGLIDSQ